jgi:hypothetical protein
MATLTIDIRESRDLERDKLVPEPIAFLKTPDGRVNFTKDLPWRTVIDVRGGFLFGPEFRVDVFNGIITITLNGRRATYVRRAYDPNGNWICNLREDELVSDDS